MLELEDGTKLELDRTFYALKFESAMLQLENLTPHQEEVYKQIAEELRVDIRAPAGAGKTFLALKALLEALLEALGSEAAGQAAFVTRNEALCLHVTKWLFVRLAQCLVYGSAHERASVAQLLHGGFHLVLVLVRPLGGAVEPHRQRFPPGARCRALGGAPVSTWVLPSDSPAQSVSWSCGEVSKQ